MRFFGLSLASLVEKHWFLTKWHVWNPDLSFSFQAQTPKRGHYHLANRPLQSASQSLHPRYHTSKSASPKMYFPGHLPKGLVFLIKGKNVPTEHEEPQSLISFQTYIIFLHPILTLFSWIKRNFSFSTFPFVPTWLFISRISFFLNPRLPPHSILKGHFQVILSRKLSWSPRLHADFPPPSALPPRVPLLYKIRWGAR